MISKWLEEAEYGSHVEEIDETVLILTNQRRFLITYVLGCTQRECKLNEITSKSVENVR